ncbi:hypothetical protein QAD02_006105 [Eretmocerus hayati]|uniref:Uncharacterized protein n=1 Tax=Eretmocerus hayati TaxID=131215 RepID=A0ACC2N118_9HYME|nr:hypothetical protein QAD02_006105 [Eretmocerus hayati]
MEDKHREYDVLKQVGEGSFGQVFKARRKCDGATVAYKVTRKKGRSPKELESLRRECEIQKDMRHPNIIQMLDSFETKTEIVVVTEYVEKELYEILGKAGRLSEERAQVIACDLVSALHYLHSKRIVHRDMKPQNVLLDTNGVAKLCDFGFACHMESYFLRSIKGTPLYMAPELINEKLYDHNVDLWSLGCIVYELVNGVPPFPTSSMIELTRLILHKEIEWPKHISPNCQSFLQGLLQKNPCQRLTWPDLLEHPFVKGRILMASQEAEPRSLTSPLSASQTRAKQQQMQSFASRFTIQSKKILGMQRKKTQSLKRSENSGSESSTSVDVLLNNLSLRASLRSDLVAADYAICQHDCPIAEDEPLVLESSEPRREDSIEPPSMDHAVEVYETPNSPYAHRDLSECQSRLRDWQPRDSEQPLENDEWVAFLQRSMEEAMDGEVSSFLQDNCMSVFASPLKNPCASWRVIEHVACLVSLPLVLGQDKLGSEDLDTVLRVYLRCWLVPNLVYALELINRKRESNKEDDEEEEEESTRDEDDETGLLQAQERTMLILCRLVHTKQEFVVQFCDAVYLIPNGLSLFQQMLDVDKCKPELVCDVIAIMSHVLRSRSDNSDLVEGILTENESSDETSELLTKLLTHSQSKLKARACVFVLLLGEFCRTTLQRIWRKSLRDVLETLAEDEEKPVRDNATEAVSSLKQLSFYNRDGNSWSAIET